MKLTGIAHNTMEPEHNVCLQSLRDVQKNMAGTSRGSAYYKELDLMRQFYVRKLSLIMEFIGLIEAMEAMSES